MTRHPLTITLWLLEALTWLVYLAASGRIVAALSGWRPEGRDREDYVRARHLELAGFQGYLILALQSVSLVVLVLAVAWCWPDLTPGAMCGSGVLQAMGKAGVQTLVLRTATVMLLCVWFFLSSLDATDPLARLSTVRARVLLCSGPLLYASGVYLYRALSAVEPDQAVSCCSALYDPAVFGGGLSAGLFGWPPAFWVAACLLGWAAVCLWAARQWRRPRAAGGARRTLAACLVFVWMAASLMALKYGFTPYIYQVLSHPCLWCLFLAEHYFLGAALFGLLGWAGYENLSLLVAGVAADRCQVFEKTARLRIQRAGLRLLIACLGFMAVAAGPAIVWRLRFGQWL